MAQEKYDLLLRRFGAASFKELDLEVYTPIDQALMASKDWDYNNPNLLTNQIYQSLTELDLSELGEDERVWFDQILWFWNHHAISCAILRYCNLAAARSFAREALKYQGKDHPNQITWLFHLLLEDRVEEAKSHVERIVDREEKETGLYLLRVHRDGWVAPKRWQVIDRWYRRFLPVFVEHFPGQYLLVHTATGKWAVGDPARDRLLGYNDAFRLHRRLHGKFYGEFFAVIIPQK